MTHRFTIVFSAFVLALLATSTEWLLPVAHAQVFNGPGLFGGMDWATMIAGPSIRDPLDLVYSIILFVLSFVSLAAVIVIIIAGIRLIVSQGNEEQKDKAKKAIIYAIVGLIVILLSRIIVSIVWVVFSL